MGNFKKGFSVPEPNSLWAHNPLAEWCEAQFGQFKVLYGEWDADNCDGCANTKHDMGDHDPDAAEDEPDYVQDEVDAAVAPGYFYNIQPERRHTHPCQLQGLYSQGDSDYGQAQGQASKQITEGNENTASQKKPQYIGYKTDQHHRYAPVINDSLLNFP
jgi:hypothetical protein